MSETPENILQAAGRTMAIKQLRTAVSSSKDGAMAANQVYILQCAAIHILATIAYNAKVDGGASIEDVLGLFIEQIGAEADQIIDSETFSVPIQNTEH